MRFLSSIMVRIAIGPLLLVLASGISLLLFDMRGESALRQVIAQHDESSRLKDVIQQAMGSMAAAHQTASDYMLLSDAGLVTAQPGERRRVRYRLRSAPMRVAQQFLAALARDWDGSLDALQEHLNR